MHTSVLLCGFLLIVSLHHSEGNLLHNSLLVVARLLLSLNDIRVACSLLRILVVQYVVYLLSVHVVSTSMVIGQLVIL